MSESPGSLQTPKPKTTRMSKKPMYLLLAGVLAMAGVLYYSINISQQAEKDMEEEKKQVTTDGRSLADMDGPGGLAVPDPEESGIATPASAVKTDKAAREGGPLVTVVQTSTKEDEAAAAKRKKQEQTYTVALMSPLVPHRGVGKRGDQQHNQGANTATVDRQEPQTTPMPKYPAHPDSYDPAADVDKEQFFSRSADHGDRGWLSPYTREAGRQFEIKTGAVIPGVMVTGINSDLPGAIVAQVSQNVYDTATGKYVLLPQGAKLYGSYDSRVVYGQSRVLIAWNRVIFPDGTSVTLGAMPGADMSGYAGFEDEVDNHYLRVFGSAVLMSLITGGSSYAVDKMSNNSDEDNTTMQSAMGAAFATQMGQAATKLLEKNLNIKPTLSIRPGYQFNIVVIKDVAFREPYREISMNGRRR